jgi:hypothetical protein
MQSHQKLGVGTIGRSYRRYFRISAEIAADVGYAEGVTLRALLRRRLGRGVGEIRRYR